MGKIVLGFALGAAVTGTAFLLFHSSPPDAATAFVPDSEALEAESTDFVNLGDQRDRDSAPANSVRQTPGPSQFAEDDESREATLVQELNDAQRAVGEISQELEQLRMTKSLAAPVLFPMSLPSEFSWLLDDPTVQLLHGLIQREERDEAWAAPMEAEIQRFLYGQREIISEFGSPTITCRSSRCEVTFINGAADEQSHALAMRLRSEFSQHELRDRFSLSPDSFWVGEHYEDGVATILWNLPRRPQ